MEIELLQGSSAYIDVQSDLNMVSREYQGIKKQVFDKFPQHFPANLITEHEYKHMMWIYNSRVFFIEGRNPREHLVCTINMVLLT